MCTWLCESLTFDLEKCDLNTTISPLSLYLPLFLFFLFFFNQIAFVLYHIKHSLDVTIAAAIHKFIVTVGCLLT